MVGHYEVEGTLEGNQLNVLTPLLKRTPQVVSQYRTALGILRDRNFQGALHLNQITWF